MEIGIDAICWWNRRGFGRFTRELLKALFAEPRGHRFCLFVDQPPAPEMDRRHVRVVRVGTRRTVTEAAVATDNRSPMDIWRFCRAVAAERLDVMFFPAVYSWFPVPGRSPPSVVTLHDAIAEHFPHLVFPDLRRRMLWSVKVRLACLQARRLLTVSNAALSEIVRYIGVAPDRIDVVCEGANAGFRPIADPERRAAARARAGLPQRLPFLIYVGGLAPHKNLGTLLDGLALAVQNTELSALQLALVGDPEGAGFHSNRDELQARVTNDPRLCGRVYFTGFVADGDLAALYSDAVAAVLPSVSEGFGLPVLEAMACGTPVLTANAGAAPEIAGEGGLQFAPLDPTAIADAIRRVVREPATREALARHALVRAGTYSWQRGARLTLDALERSVGSR